MTLNQCDSDFGPGLFFYPLVSSSFHNPMKSLHSGKLIKWVHSTQRERGNYRFLVAPFPPPPPFFFSLSLSWTCRFIWIKDKTHFYVGCCSQSGENIGSLSHSREMKIWGGGLNSSTRITSEKTNKKKCTQRRREKKKKVEWPLDPYFDSRKYAGWSGGLVPFG